MTIGLSGCQNYVTPKKVDRIISKDGWKITNFNFEGQDVTSEFNGKIFGFGESGSITVLPFTGVTGKWNTGLNKKPTILYIQGFIDAPYFYLNDDWEVVECSKSTFKLESSSGSYLNKVTFKKDEN